jgi:hypothetical protein
VLKVDDEIWSGDRLDFRVRAIGQVAAGNVQVGDHAVRLEVTLPWLLHEFGQAVQRTIEGRGHRTPRELRGRPLSRVVAPK